MQQTVPILLTSLSCSYLPIDCSYLANCSDQAHDGAANMSGCINDVTQRILNDVTQRILNERPKAHYIHCAAHSLILCLQDCGIKCKFVRYF